MARSKWISFGAQQALNREAQKGAKPASSPAPTSSAEAKMFGLENFGNTCYANSVLQALYFCTPFRDLMLQAHDPSVPQDLLPQPAPPPPQIPTKPSTFAPVRWKPERKPSTSGHPTDNIAPSALQPIVPSIPSSPPTLFSALRSLFYHISSQPGDKGTVSPRAFIEKLKQLNDIFRSTMHQDAHEFLNYLLNRIVEEMEEERKQSQNGAHGEELSGSVATLSSKIPPTVLTATSSNSGTNPQDATLVHRLFEGVLTSETRCLTCETVSSRDESFLDLSIDIEQNSSVTACLRQFSASEMLCQRNKFFCDSCCDLQEAEKRMKIKKLPNVLALHLKRFKYQEDVARYIKLAYRVAFPMELRLFNTVDDMDDADRLYNLFAIVVHIGNGPHHGHYVSIIKNAGSWFVFDDDNVYPITESDIPKYFGDSNSGSAYVLYYEAADIDPIALGLRIPEPPAPVVDSNLPETLLPLPAPAFDTNPPILFGLGHENGVSESSDLSLPQLSSSAMPQPQLIVAERPSLVLSPVNVTVLPNDSDLSPPSAQSIVPSPSTPSGFGTKLMNTLRRAPSATLSRGNTIVDASRRSGVERSPRPSASSPALAGKEDGKRSLEHIPPLPPLPPNIQTSISIPIPVPQPQSNGEDKEKSRKESTKSPGGWFAKRKSLRLGEKSKTPIAESIAPLPPSPNRRVDDPHLTQTQPSSSSPSNWFRTSSHTARDTQLSENGRPNELEVLDISKPHKTRPRSMNSGQTSTKNAKLLNRYDETPSPGSTSSSLNSVPLANISTPQTYRPSTGASTSSSVSGPKPQEAPRGTPRTHPSTHHRRQSHEHKKVNESRGVSPSNHNRQKHLPPSSPSPYSSSTHTTDLQRNLPPLPPTPQFSSHKHSLSNGYPYVAEPESIPQHFQEPMAGVDPVLFPADLRQHARSTTLPPSSMTASIGANISTGSTPSTTSGIRKATRKLSLTAPMLGFGRNRDKKG